MLICAGLAPGLVGCTSRASQAPATSFSPTASLAPRTSPASPAPRTSATSPAPGPTAGEARSATPVEPEDLAGRCLMVGLSATGDPDQVAGLVRRHRLAGVFLLGHWNSTARIRSTAARIHSAARAAGSPRAIVAADQEGGLVRNLISPEFTAMPSAAALGAGSPSTCRELTRTVGSQMRAAGLNLVLAPVADVVDPRLGADNAPIGALHRGFGSDPARVARFVSAAVTGFGQGGVATSVKHFPGLGAVEANTDLSVATDTTTTATSPTLAPFLAGIAAGSQTVMVSSAIYSRICPSAPAVFSSAVITSLLRGRLGFDGVVLSDDLGSARAVAAVPVSHRGSRFLAAGGDLALCADPSLVPAMVEGMSTRVPPDRLRVSAARVEALLSRLSG